MPAPIDLERQRFGKLVAIKPTKKRSGGHVIWACMCDCGKLAEVAACHLRKFAEGRGGTGSCGCANNTNCDDRDGRLNSIIKLKAEGLSMAEIGERVGLSKTRVVQLLRPGDGAG